MVARSSYKCLASETEQRGIVHVWSSMVHMEIEMLFL